MADNIKLDDLQIDIVVNSSKAASALKDLATSLRDVGRAGKDASSGATSASKGVQDLGKTVAEAGSSAKNSEKSIRDTGKAIKEAGNEAKHASGKFENFIHSVGRIAMYRAIRSAIKLVTQAVSEGFNMFVTWDREQNNFGAGAAAQVDKLTASWTQLKGQIGALGGALANTLVPIITWVVDALTKVVDLFQMIIRSLQGEYTYYSLIYQEASATTGAAKELKRVLFGFDDLNVLPSKSGGGVSSSGGSWLYEELPINSGFLNTIADVSNKIKEFFGLTDDGQNIIGGLVGVVGTLLGAKALGGLLGLLPRLISGFGQKNSALADQTSKVTADATATEGLATQLGSATQGAWNLGGALGGIGWGQALAGASGLITIISLLGSKLGETKASADNLNKQLNNTTFKFKTTADLSGAKAVTDSISSTKRYADSNPIKLKTVADISGAASVASGIAVMQGYASSNPVVIKITAPMLAMAKSMSSLRNSIQSFFNINPISIPLSIANGRATGYGKLSTGISSGDWANMSATDLTNYAESTGLNLTSSDKKTLGLTVAGVLAAPITAAIASVSPSLLTLLLPALNYASGGTPSVGTLFYAGEAGAEVVANTSSGHTGVMNVGQMQEAVASGNVELINTLIEVGNMLGSIIQNKDNNVYLDGAKIGQSVTRYQNNQARRGMATQGAY